MLPVAIGRRSVDIYMHPIPYPEDTGSLPPLQNTCNVSFDEICLFIQEVIAYCRTNIFELGLCGDHYLVVFPK